ncbi:hypothetical protein HWV62_32122 [Athelia sp. TMB]|nr:hypothetical protein HWV62_32122 [Athelia sp. TMB]
MATQQTAIPNKTLLRYPEAGRVVKELPLALVVSMIIKRLMSTDLIEQARSDVEVALPYLLALACIATEIFEAADAFACVGVDVVEGEVGPAAARHWAPRGPLGEDRAIGLGDYDAMPRLNVGYVFDAPR